MQERRGEKRSGWRITNVSSCLNMRRGIVEKFEQGPSVSPTVQFHVVKTRIYSRRIPWVRADNVIAFRSDYNVSVSQSLPPSFFLSPGDREKYWSP